MSATRQIRCGLCDFPQQAHTAPNRLTYDELCFRDSLDDNWGLAVFDLDSRYPKFDYERGIDSTTNSIFDLVLTDVAGPESLTMPLMRRDGSYVNGVFTDETDYVSSDVEVAKLSRWRDTATTPTGDFFCTPTLEQHRSPQMGDSTEVIIAWNGKGAIVPAGQPEVSNETRNAYIEGADGFTSVKLLDEVLTQKYHARLLNVFADKQTNAVRIGSIRLSTNADGTKHAECVRNDCIAKMDSVSLTDLTYDEARFEMERFVLAIIRHGNNHAAKWFTERDTYYKLHEPACDGLCDPNQYHCYGHTTRPIPANEADQLVEHYRNCKTPGCTCVDLLVSA